MSATRNELIFFLVLGCIVKCSTAEPTYLIYFPKYLRPGFPIQFVAEILNHTNPIKLTASLISPAQELDFKLEANISQGESKLLTFDDMIPMDYKGTTDFEMSISGIDTVTNKTVFQNSTSELSYKQKAVSIFVQTDKGIYKRSQTIKFRAVVTTPDLRPYDGKVSFKITDPDENIVLQQKDSELHYGLLGSEFTLNRYATLGDWKVTFLANEYEKSVTVSVEEYKLPKFEVKVETPVTYLHPESKNIAGKVIAEFTFGQPVKADYVQLVFKAVSKWSGSYYYWYNPEEERSFEQRYYAMDGQLNFTVGLDSLKQTLKLDFYGDDLEITALVRDKNSLVELSGTTTVALVSTYNRLKVEEIFVPKNMKPGLQYTAYMKISEYDGKLLSADEKASVGLQMEMQTVTGVYPNAKYDNRKENLTIGDNGMIIFSTDLTDYEQLILSVTSNVGSLLNWQVNKFDSPSGMYVQVSTQNTNLKPGDNAALDVTTTTKKSFTITMMARGKIIHQEIYNPDSYEEVNSMFKFSYTFAVTKDMSPSVTVMIFFMGTKGDIVSDSVILLVEYTFDNKVEVQSSTNRTETGKTVSITVETSPNSLLALRAIDRSVILKKEGNDITSESIVEDLDEYGTSKQKKRPIWFCYFMGMEGSNSRELFQKSGLIVFTDAQAFLNQEINRHLVYEDDYMFDDNEIMFAMADSVPEVELQADTSAGSTVTENAPAVQTRKNFPETWIWQENEVGSTGMQTFSFVLPDTATTWEISAFAISETTGLGVSMTNPQIIATRDFFISLELPVSLVVGEEPVMRATVYNFFEDSLDVVLTLEKSELYEVVMATNGGTSAPGYEREITIPSGDGKTENFTIRFLKPGNAIVMINALSEIAGDRVEKQVLIKPEGVQSEKSQSMLVQRSSASADPSLEVFVIDIPEEATEGSVYGKISVSGNIMGNALSNLGNLLKMPSGCGEQNMLNFAPDVYISLYLKKVNLLTGQVAQKSRRHIQQGYRGELRYRRDDGSFSAFGNSDQKGSTWLTAFVTKCFISAMELSEDLVDYTVVDEAISFLLSKQKNGAFHEDGVVSHRDMQGGVSSRKSATMTAYVLVAMTEGGYNLKRKDVLESITEAKEYLEEHISDIEDTFALAITTYALALSDSTFTASQMDKLESRAKNLGGLKYWVASEDKEVACDFELWDYRCSQATSSDIEITAYVLLTLIRLGRGNTVMPIVKWLVKQRGSFGGYRSTQDTVMAIQALSVFAGLFSSEEIAMVLAVTHTADSSYSSDFSISNDNSIILQSEELPPASGNVSVSASGIGFADVQVAYLFNLPIKNRSSEPFAIDTEFHISSDNNDVNVKVNVRINENGDAAGGTGMFIVNLDLPTGYTATDDTLSNKDKVAKLVELEDNGITFYFDKLDANEVLSFEFDLYRYSKVGLVKPRSLFATDYYNPARFSARSFLLPDCETCRYCDGCNGGEAMKISFLVWVVAFLNILNTIVQV